MATKFFSDGAVHAYFNPYETPYDAFMNYMNVLSDFEIRLRKLFPDTAEQDQIYKLGTQIIEKDMVIERQAYEIEKLTKKVSKIKPALKIKKSTKTLVKAAVEKSQTKEVKKPAKTKVKPITAGSAKKKTAVKSKAEPAEAKGKATVTKTLKKKPVAKAKKKVVKKK